MDELATRLERARKGVDPSWSAGDSADALGGIKRRIARRRRLRAAGLPTIALGLGLLVWWGASSRRLSLEDGSRITAIARGSELEIVEDNPERVRVSLSAGSAHFDVRRR